MFGIYLLAFGCIILAPVYAVRQSFLSYNLLKQTYFYLASNVFNMNVDLESSKESDEQLDNRSSWWQGIKQKLLNVVSVIVAAKRELFGPQSPSSEVQREDASESFELPFVCCSCCWNWARESGN